MNIDKLLIMNFKKYIIKYEDFPEQEYYVHENSLDARDCTLDELKKLVKNIQLTKVRNIFKCLKGCSADIVRETIIQHELQFDWIDRLTINASVFEDTKFIKKLLKYCNINKVNVKESDESHYPLIPLIAFVIKQDSFEMMKYIIKLGINLEKTCRYVDSNGYSVKAKPISLAFIRNNKMASLIRKNIYNI